MKRIVLVLLVLVLHRSASAQMCGDCNDDGHVDIAEIIQTINNALSGGPDPTPPADVMP
jgi:hypothetical protein